jgi:GDP-L-fucose synthase
MDERIALTTGATGQNGSHPTEIPQANGSPRPAGSMAEPIALAGRRVWVAGHGGMVGAALLRRLGREGCALLTVDRAALDLRDQAAVRAWMARERPEIVFLAAAKVGGIGANAGAPAEFIADNLLIAANVIEAAWRYGVDRLVYLGSSCIYPKFARQPIVEDALLTGALEPTNRSYAVAKIAGLELCRALRQQFGCDFVAAMPTNLYGPGDRFDTRAGHVVPALIVRFCEAEGRGDPSVTLWGTGTPRRDLLHVDDCADALVAIARSYHGSAPINIGSGSDVTIAELAREIARLVGYRGTIRFDPGKPDGTPRKLLDTRRLGALGWHPSIPLSEGLAATVAWYRERRETQAGRQANIDSSNRRSTARNSAAESSRHA